MTNSSLKMLLAAALGAFSVSYSSTPTVISSIYPIQQIANAIVGQPTELLAKSYLSPHHYTITPQDAKKIATADLLIWVDAAVIPKLESYVEKRAHSKKATIKATQLAAIQLLKFGGEATTLEHHENEHHENEHHENEHHENEHHEHEHHEHEHHEHEHHEHDHSKMAYDPHVWLSTTNAQVIATAIANELSLIDTAHAADYQGNLATFIHNLNTTKQAITERFNRQSLRPFYIFHDAYGYFENEFGIKHAGKIRGHSAQTPRTKDMMRLKEQIHHETAACLFSEPQFQSPLVDQLVANSQVTLSTLDPIGYQQETVDIERGYITILNNIANQLLSCSKP